MPLYELDMDVNRKIHRLVRKFPDNFGHIRPEHILPVMVIDAKDPVAIAEVRKIPEFMLTVVKFQIVMLVYEELFEPYPENVQNMIILHELEHIAPHPKLPYKYVLKKHTVQDFEPMVRTMGPNWTQRISGAPEFDPLHTDETDWVAALDKMALASAAMEGVSRKKKHAKKAKTGRTR